MARASVAMVHYEGRMLPVSLVTQQRPDGRYYEVNIPDFPRFRMRWSALDRYDLVAEDEVEVPYNLVLVVAELLGDKKSR